MKGRSNIKLNLTSSEKKNLRSSRIRIGDILNFSVDELEALLNSSPERAKEVYALADFQRIPSVGIRFAEDLVFLGYYSLEELKGKDAFLLTQEYELKKGYWVDPCVEDQFRLAVHVAETNDFSKNWWDFTNERKKYREENGYPDNRPEKAWHEALSISS